MELRLGRMLAWALATIVFAAPGNAQSPRWSAERASTAAEPSPSFAADRRIALASRDDDEGRESYLSPGVYHAGSLRGPSMIRPSQFSEEDYPGVMEEYSEEPLVEYAPDATFVPAGESLIGPSSEPWHWQLLPSGIVYRAYLASQKDSRFATAINYVPEWDTTFWEPTLGARVGIFRYGDSNALMPQGLQLDVEGSAQVRLDIPEEVDVTSVDFRGGIPLTFRQGPWQWKFGYYHLSSHLGDEFLLKNPGYPRLNLARDVLVLGAGYYVTEDLRLYGEMGWAFYSIVSEPWEFQFGIDYAPARATGARGAPFAAVNGHLRQELDFGGNFTVQAGWAWRSAQNGSLLRVGFHYFNGASWQYSFYQRFEQQMGVGIWYDF